MIKNIHLLFLFLCLVLVPSGMVVGSTSYHIGNSLTRNMSPAGLSAMAAQTEKDHQIGYHIRRGVELYYIWKVPDDIENETNSFGNYVNALPSYEWDFVTFQPFYSVGSTLGRDQAAISGFIDLTLAGPSVLPIFYIYSAWPPLSDDYQAFWNQPIQNDQSQQTTHAREYFDHLYQNLLNQYGTNIQLHLIPIGEVLYRLDQEFIQGVVPGYENVGSLYSDTAHLTADIGQFVAATTVYSTLFKENPVGMGRPSGHYVRADGSTDLTDELRNLIQSIVWEVVSHHSLSGVDVTPDEFTFEAALGSGLSEINHSKPISVLGINAVSVVSIVGGEYSINGGKFTGNEGIARNDDVVIVRLLSSDSYSTETAATLTVSGVSDSYRVTTVGQVDIVNTGASNVTTDAGGVGMITIVVLLIIRLFAFERPLLADTVEKLPRSSCK